MRKKNILGIFMAICMAATSIISMSTPVNAADSVNMYFKQAKRGYCTLASTAMMMRQKAFNEGNPDWANITQQGILSKAWLKGQGLRHSLNYFGVGVGYRNMEPGDIHNQLIYLLMNHPEGVAIYDRGVPHSVFLTGYDASTDTFYCADPGLSDKLMKLKDSWLKKSHSSVLTDEALQEAIINSIDGYWFVSSYNDQPIPESNNQVNLPELDNVQDISQDSDIVNPSLAIVDDPIDNLDDTKVRQERSVMAEKAKYIAPKFQKKDINVKDLKLKEENPKVIKPKEEKSKDIHQNNIKLNDIQSNNTKPKDIKPKIKVPTIVNDFSKTSFKDLNSKEWYYPYISSIYESGLMNGEGENYFKPDNNITIAQSITLAARMYSIKIGDGEQFKVKGYKWYSPYLNYAIDKNIISPKFADKDTLDFKATRGQFAEIVSGAIPDDDLAQINIVRDGDIKDVMCQGTEGKAIYKLLRGGIVTGSDNSFSPKESITRAQVAAIVARINDPNLRVSF